MRKTALVVKITYANYISSLFNQSNYIGVLRKKQSKLLNVTLVGSPPTATGSFTSKGILEKKSIEAENIYI